MLQPWIRPEVNSVPGSQHLRGPSQPTLPGFLCSLGDSWLVQGVLGGEVFPHLAAFSRGEAPPPWKGGDCQAGSSPQLLTGQNLNPPSRWSLKTLEHWCRSSSGTDSPGVVLNYRSRGQPPGFLIRSDRGGAENLHVWYRRKDPDGTRVI